jgi:uncharacterized C2H2 Zn-finger protein
MFNEYKCKICKKEYKSYQSLWNHTKIIHTEITQSVTIIHNSPPNNTHKCIRCNKLFSRSDSVKRHQNKCKIDVIIELKEEINELKNQINKISNKTSNKIINENKTITDNTQINNGTINNNNNINIKVSLGYENINDLTKQDHLKILNSGYMSLIKLIELLNLNPDLPQYNNILVTNLVDKFNSITLDDEELIKYYKDLYDEIILLIYNKT